MNMFVNKLILSVFFVILAFDYRGEVDGGGTFQYALVAATCFFGSLLCVLNLRGLYRLMPIQRKLIYGFAFLLVFSVGVFFKNQIPFGNYIRVLIPPILGGFAFYGISVVARDINSIIYISRLLLIVSMASAVWKAAYAFLVLSLDVSVIRYQLLSQGTGISFAAALFFVTFPNRKIFFWCCVLIAAMGVVMISITRTHIASAAIVVLCIGYMLFRVRKVGGRGVLVRWFVMTGVVVALFAFIIAPLALYFRPDVLEDWEARLFHSKFDITSIDPTAAIRIAQIRGQLQDMAAHPIDILFGRGFGQAFTMDVDFYLQHGSGAQMEAEEMRFLLLDSWQNPDSLYVPIFYCGGAYFACFFAVLIWSALRPLGRISSYFAFPELFEVYGWLVCAIIYMLVVGVFGNIFLDRLGAPLFFGMCALAISIRPYVNVGGLIGIQQVGRGASHASDQKR